MTVFLLRLALILTVSYFAAIGILKLVEDYKSRKTGFLVITGLIDDEGEVNFSIRTYLTHIKYGNDPDGYRLLLGAFHYLQKEGKKSLRRINEDLLIEQFEELKEITNHKRNDKDV